MPCIVGAGSEDPRARAVCYTLKRQDEEYLGGLREKVLDATAIAAACAMRLDGTSAPSSFTIGHRGSLSFT